MWSVESIVFINAVETAERMVRVKTKVKVKKKAVVSAKVVDMTVRDFQKSMGLGKDMAGYIAATQMVKMLVDKGIVKEVARLHVGTGKLGRKSVIYRVPVRFTLSAKLVGSEAA